MYAQKNYLAIQGINGKYRLDQIGCFVTAFSNLFSDFGRDISPLVLNNELVAKGIYIDIDDGVRDDLGWSSITQDDGSIVVSRTVDHGTAQTAGWPSSNNSIVRFYYRSVHSGQMIFHFCKVADAAAHTIVDSWDGAVKQSPYGEPTAYAEYVHNVPVPVSPPPADPVGISPKLFLPAAAGKWRVYRLGGPWTVGNEIGTLWPGNPAWAPGLTYDVLGKIASNIFKIHTESYGDVAIYAGADTIAQWVSEAPAAPAPVAPPAPALVITDNTDTVPVTVNPPAPEAPAPPAEAAPVTPESTPVDPEAWKKTTKNVADYKATEDYLVTNLADGSDYADLAKGQVVHAVERFTKDGIDFVLTQKSIDKNVFAGVPLGALKLVEAFDIAEPDDDTIFNGMDLTGFADRLDEQIKKVDTRGFRQRVVKIVGEIMVWFTKNKNKKIGVSK